jgi:hypothetical protein
MHSISKGKSVFFRWPLAAVRGKIDRSGTQVKETLDKGTEKLFKISMVRRSFESL